jgi:outer membrane biosynthesis protein TonB
MQRAEQTGLGISVLGHVAIFTILSLGLFAVTKPPVIPPAPMDVQIVDKVGLTDTAPEPPKVAPAQSVAPEVGSPEEAAPEPEPTPAPPTPAPVQREAVAPPKPAPAPKPIPKAVAKPAVKPAPPKPTVKPSVAPVRGSKLGDDFRKGLTAAPSNSTSQAPRVVSVGPAQLAGLAAAIRRQVQPCADRIATPGPGAERITTKINLQMNRDGSFAANPRVVSQVTDEDNARYGARVGELAKAAFVQCSPFELPPELYDGWKNINLNYKLPG